MIRSHDVCDVTFCVNENPFQVSIGKYSSNYLHALLTLSVTVKSHPPSALNMSAKIIYLF